MPGEGGRHPLAVLPVGARHRHQELHGHVRRDLAGAYLLLHAFGKQLDQGQPPRHPAHAAIEAPCQLLESITEALLEFRQQPALLQRRLALRPAQRAVQHQRLDLGHRPDHRFHRVPAQLLQCREALVAVDDQVPLRLVLDRGLVLGLMLVPDLDHYDRRLLARCGQ